MTALKNVFSKFNQLIFKNYFWLLLLGGFLVLTSHYSITIFLANFSLSLIVLLISILGFNRKPFSFFFAFFFIVFVHIAAILKINYLNFGLVLEDLYFISHFRDFAADELIFSYMGYRHIVYLAICIVFTVYLFIYSSPILEFKNIKNKLSFIIIRSIMVGVAILIVNLSWKVISSPDSIAAENLIALKKSQKKYCSNIFDKDNKQKAVCDYIGPLADIMSNISDSGLKAKALKQDSSLVKEYVKRNSDVKKHAGSYPDIVLILNESTFNPVYLDYNFAKNFDYQFFKDKEYTKASGLLNVHTLGGGSSLSEYPTVTGITHSVFKGKVNYPFINLVDNTKSSLFRELKKLGYYIVVVYPVEKNFVNANYAYRVLGADKVVDVKDYGFKPKKWRDVPDEVVANMISQELKEGAKEGPVFVFGATMINHGPHEERPDLINCAPEIDKKVCGKVNDYINRLESTNRDFMRFNNELMKRERKTIFFNYGDHLPSFEGEITNLRFDYGLKEVPDYYRTFYNIRANFSLNDDYNYQIMDISYIPSVILDIIGGSNNEFYRASSLLRKKCNGKFLNCDESNLNLVESYKALMVEQLGVSPRVK